jgi:hypothetical protein
MIVISDNNEYIQNYILNYYYFEDISIYLENAKYLITDHLDIDFYIKFSLYKIFLPDTYISKDLLNHSYTNLYFVNTLYDESYFKHKVIVTEYDKYIFTGENLNQLERINRDTYYDYNNVYIQQNNSILLTEYPTYREEQNKFSNKKHYGMLWKERAIYIN